MSDRVAQFYTKHRLTTLRTNRNFKTTNQQPLFSRRITRRITIFFLIAAAFFIITTILFNVSFMLNKEKPNCDDNKITLDQLEVETTLDQPEVETTLDQPEVETTLDQPEVVTVFSDDHAAHSQHRRRRKIAYTTLSYGKECPALTCTLNIREVINKYNKSDSCGDDDDIIDVIIIRVGTAIPESKLPQNVTQRVVNPTKAQGLHTWTHTYSKFWIATWYEYDAVVFLDSDVLLLKPLDELIDLAIAIPGSIISPRAYWMVQPYAMAGIFVLSPQASERSSTAAVSELHSILNGRANAIGDGDMDWVNNKLINQLTLVSGWYTLLCGEFWPSDKIYNYFGKQLELSPNETLNQAPSVHFIAEWKPWATNARNNPKITPELKELYNIWDGVEKRACV